jgi:hypothetical protein
MRLVATSDCHGKLGEVALPPGDVLVLAGDLLADAPDDARDPDGWQADALRALDTYLADLPFRLVLLVAGNHDGVLQRRPDLGPGLRGARYLEDAGLELDGVRFWGSPWQTGLWHHPFFLPDGREARAAFGKVPASTDVLVTHSPPWGCLDVWDPPHRLGSRMLRARVAAVGPRVHIFGHMHPSYGAARLGETRAFNAALCDERGAPANPPHVVDL